MNKTIERIGTAKGRKLSKPKRFAMLATNTRVVDDVTGKMIGLVQEANIKLSLAGDLIPTIDLKVLDREALKNGEVKKIDYEPPAGSELKVLDIVEEGEYGESRLIKVMHVVTDPEKVRPRDTRKWARDIRKKKIGEAS